MYASYFYSAEATAANILADVVAILTGETTVANLSAGCDKVNTTIDASVAVAGWTSHDASAGTNAVCLKAAVADNASQYKYLVIDTNSDGYIHTKVYEDWNATTHAGTNLAYYSDQVSVAQRVNTATGGRIDISASIRHAFMFSLQGGVFGSSTGNYPSGVLERTRRSPWDTVANGYPPFAHVSGMNATTFREPRIVNASGADITGSSITNYPIHSFGGGSSTLVNTPATTVVANEAKTVFKHALVNFGLVNPAVGHLGGDFSSLCDIYLTTYNNGASFDTIAVDNKTYIVWACGTTYRFAVRQG